MSIYPFVLLAHICAITISGCLFLARGLAVLFGASWPLARPVKALSYSLDTVLLAAALTLVFILPKEVFANQWLNLKLVLVVSYIVLGVIAMRATVRKTWRWVAFGTAEAVFLNIIGIAVTHSPWGWFGLATGY